MTYLQEYINHYNVLAGFYGLARLDADNAADRLKVATQVHAQLSGDDISAGRTPAEAATHTRYLLGVLDDIEKYCLTSPSNPV
jgi:hypothetical protein